MEIVSRGTAKQLMRAVRAGASWEQVRESVPGVAPEYLDEHLKAWVLETAGTPPAPVVSSSPPKTKRRKG